jgi:membrane-bound serine protease (ClpP class)
MARLFRRCLTAWLLALLCAGLARGAWAQGSSALVLTVEGGLTPAHAIYLERSLDRARAEGAEVVILQLNTPGGQIDLMDRLVAMLRESAVPVVVYVAPRGAMAGSAGTVLTLAGHAAAMAPESTIGAASPVGGQGENLDSTSETKVKEIMKAKVRALAAARPPEAIALAEATIESAQAATADEAVQIGLVDFLAADVPDLLRQLDGYEVQVDGQPRVLHTGDLAVQTAGMNFVEQALNLLTNPNIVFLLLALGAQAILIELASPGGWVAGFVGAVSLALAFYGLGVLPVNWFGLIFVGLAFVLFIMEVHAPTHGGLAAAGTASLIAGGLVLFNSPGSPSFLRVSVPLVVVTSLLLAAAFVVLVSFALRAQRRPIVVGVESLIGQVGEVRAPEMVQVAGELWSAEPAESGGRQLEPGQQVVITGVRGLRLLVRPK